MYKCTNQSYVCITLSIACITCIVHICSISSSNAQCNYYRCSMNNCTSGFSQPLLAVVSSTNAASAVVCLLAVTLVCVLKLYKKLVYRLALYQVLSALVYAGQFVGQAVFVRYSVPDLCIAFAYFNFYALYMKILFTVWVTFHLFCYTVFQKNLRKLEPLYIAMSLLAPAVIASLPLATHTYGMAGSWCSIQEWQDNCPSKTLVAGVIEQFVLGYGFPITCLILTSFAMAVITVVLIYRSCFRRTQNYKQHRKAVKLLLPLAIYPVAFLVFVIPVFAKRVYDTTSPEGHYELSIAGGVFIAAWSMLAGMALLVHVLLTGVCAKRLRGKIIRRSPGYRSINVNGGGEALV